MGVVRRANVLDIEMPWARLKHFQLSIRFPVVGLLRCNCRKFGLALKCTGCASTGDQGGRGNETPDNLNETADNLVNSGNLLSLLAIFEIMSKQKYNSNCVKQNTAQEFTIYQKYKHETKTLITHAQPLNKKRASF